MSFFIPAETAKSVGTGNLPPDTGYYAVEITQFEDRGVLDRQGNFSYFIHLKFPNGSTTREIGSCPFDSEGNMAPALQAMDEQSRNKKIGGMVAALKRVALSSGITEDYMAENGLNTEHLVGRTAYIEWLGRPKDTPQGVRAYGETKSFINQDVYEKATAEGKLPEDNRQFAWRRNTGGSSSSANAGGGAKMPPPPPRAGGFPPPPRS